MDRTVPRRQEAKGTDAQLASRLASTRCVRSGRKRTFIALTLPALVDACFTLLGHSLRFHFFLFRSYNISTSLRNTFHMVPGHTWFIIAYNKVICRCIHLSYNLQVYTANRFKKCNHWHASMALVNLNIEAKKYIKNQQDDRYIASRVASSHTGAPMPPCFIVA